LRVKWGERFELVGVTFEVPNCFVNEKGRRQRWSRAKRVDGEFGVSRKAFWKFEKLLRVSHREIKRENT
jgi:hypothetical protein